jgi:hypothetical protein
MAARIGRSARQLWWSGSGVAQEVEDLYHRILEVCS